MSPSQVADERQTHRDRERDTEKMMVASLYWVLGAASVVFHLEMGCFFFIVFCFYFVFYFCYFVILVFWELLLTVLVEAESENFLGYETNKH